MDWVIWAGMLLLQNAAFTWVSRARNSTSISYHALASVCSNGVWFLNLGLAVDKINSAWGSWGLLLLTATFYTVFTVVGSVSAHYFLMTKIETGKRKVGG
jgi:hypothetical protein